LFISISQVKASFGQSKFREHKLFDNSFESIGITLSGKYTDVELFKASLSRGEFSVTYSATSAI
jgi:hypothetical protein